MNTEEAKVVMKVLEAWEKSDTEGMLECFSEDGIYDNMPDNNPLVGCDAIRP